MNPESQKNHLSNGGGDIRRSPANLVLLSEVMRLRVASDPSGEKFFPLEPGSNLIGRWDPESASFPEIDLESLDHDAKISRKHAVLHVSEQALELEDVGSLNGTFLNRTTRLEPGRRYSLAQGDQIAIGQVILVVELAS